MALPRSDASEVAIRLLVDVLLGEATIEHLENEGSAVSTEAGRTVYRQRVVIGIPIRGAQRDLLADVEAARAPKHERFERAADRLMKRAGELEAIEKAKNA